MGSNETHKGDWARLFLAYNAAKGQKMSQSSVQLSCGCEVGPDKATGVWKNLSRCQFHMDQQHRVLTDVPLSYYLEDTKYIRDGIPQNHNYVRELTDALRLMGTAISRSNYKPMLEIGAGLGPYTPYFLGLGYEYRAVEPCTIAARWLREVYGVTVAEKLFEHVVLHPVYYLIFSAHSLEHMVDAPTAVQRMFHGLAPGGSLLLIVPDDSDLANPDHEWFFTVETLQGALEQTGFIDVRVVAQKVIERERFIYAKAMKPG